MTRESLLFRQAPDDTHQEQHTLAAYMPPELHGSPTVCHR